LNFVTELRNLNEVIVQFDIDSGDGFLKFCISLQTPNDSTNIDVAQDIKKKKDYNKKFSESGVKKLFIIFLAPDVQENYTNISLI